MSTQNEELREQIANLKKKIALWFVVQEFCCDYRTAEKEWDKATEEEKAVYLGYASDVIGEFHFAVGGKSNFEAALNLMEQTRGKCPECKGTGEGEKPAYFELCPACKGSGQGKVQIERIVMLDDNETIISKKDMPLIQ